MRLIRIADVHSILSNRESLSSPIYIKPDMTKEERHRESVLLKERWNLIQSGVPKKVIRIQGSRLYVRNALHGQLKNSMFVASTASTVSSHDPCSNEHSQSPASQPVYACTSSTSATAPNVSDNLQDSNVSPPRILPIVNPSTSHTSITASGNVSNSEDQSLLPRNIVRASKPSSISPPGMDVSSHSTD